MASDAATRPLVKQLGLTDITTVGNETYTGTQLAQGLITRDPNGGARTDTTDTALNIIAALRLGGDEGSAFVYLINTADAAEAITIAGGTGVTIANAGQTIGQNESAILLFRKTADAAVTCYILGA